MSISQKDRAILRDLAKYQLELNASARNQQLYRDWMEYGDFSKVTRPMIQIELWTFQQDILPQMMRCEGEEARKIEEKMLSPIANFTLFEDDMLVPDHYKITDPIRFLPFGLSVKKKETAGVGHHFIPYLTTLEDDDHLLGPSQYQFDTQAALAEQREAEDVFGDILPVRRESECAVICLTQDIVHIMNMDDMYVAMIDEEDRWHKLMRRLTDDYLAFFRQMERDGQLLSSARGQHLGQGSYCFTNELPDEKPNASMKDLWIFSDSQETAAISSTMYEELVFPYYKEIMESFGLSSYGCCEASHPIWDNCLSKLNNLRKVSISPWCDEEFMGERLQGSKVTFLRKPPATLLGVGSTLDEEETRACFRKTAQAAKGCKLEIAQRDVYQINNTPDKVKRYVEIAREELEK